MAAFNVQKAALGRARIDLRGVDLAGLDLRKADITRLDLSGADLSRCRVGGLGLTMCRLQGTRIAGLVTDDGMDEDVRTLVLLWQDPAAFNRARTPMTSLDGADLSGADLGVADLRRMGLGGANLAGADLSRCALEGAYLTHADLTGARLTGARLERTDLSRADLSRVDATGVHLVFAKLDEARLDEACFARASIDGCSMHDTHAGRASFVGATFLRTSPYQSAFPGADFSGATFDTVRFNSCVLAGARFTGARAHALALSDSDLTDVDLDGLGGDPPKLERVTVQSARMAAIGHTLVAIPAQRCEVGLDPARIPGLVEELEREAFAQAVAERDATDEDDGLHVLPAVRHAAASSDPVRIRTALELLGPRRLVDVGAFAIDRTRVTQAQYRTFVAETGHRPPTSWPHGEPPEGQGRFPVLGVSHDDAAAYARWAGLALPTEIEWEVAAGVADGRRFPRGDQRPAQIDDAAEPVDAHPELASPHGVLGLVGSSWEWTASPFEPLSASDREGFVRLYPHAKPTWRALRGGFGTARSCLWDRAGNDPAQASLPYGFRCVLRRAARTDPTTSSALAVALGDREALRSAVLDALRRLQAASAALPAEGDVAPVGSWWAVTHDDPPVRRVELEIGRAPPTPGRSGPAPFYLRVSVVTEGEGTRSSQFIELTTLDALKEKMTDAGAVAESVLCSIDGAIESMRRHSLR